MVKIVKCWVQHMWVDISFNQVAGLHALCFLEQMDQYIGRGNLFKQSLILIKAWCFYESRLLGSHCNLMSTYALEILVLYIINIFHCSLSGPLAVLYKFLDYYSTLDWDKYCISVYGPVDINFLAKADVETSATRGTNLLLGKNFLESCIKSFSTSKGMFETERQEFQIKHLNIIDPLNHKNNLGRSISKGNLCRMKIAFSYGYEKLRDVLKGPLESIGEGVMGFLVNTIKWSGRLQTLDAEVSVVDNQSSIFHLKGDYNCPIQCLNYSQWYINSDEFRQSSLQTLPSVVQSQSIEDEFSQNIYFAGGADCFVPSSIVHPNASQLLDSVLSVDETENYLGKGTSVPPASSKGKFKLSASAPPFISSPVSERAKCEGTGLFIPKVDIEREPKSKERDLRSPEAQCHDWRINSSQMKRYSVGSSLKTSTSNRMAGGIPFKSSRVRESSRFNVPREGHWLLSSRKTSAESDKDAGSSTFVLSLDDFPLLSSCKKPVTSRKAQPDSANK
nr:uncharacterized protein LOC113725288 isoform X3 [Coffea arabica]XP_027104172.1 uncharacterized protein LOC113725288 isoform X3 [Coffea arabica]XP_027110629.1 uncharacterized protein LOC113730258 isoform X3 [Coffea arabica]XP_027110630.1 uncharacterized protein LOC113730258 isoform X3 [Coffea arabica]